jgi:hypothetical protein
MKYLESLIKEGLIVLLMTLKNNILLINYQKIYNFKKFDNISERNLKKFLSFFEFFVD